MSEHQNQYPWIELGAKLPAGRMVRNHFVWAKDQNGVGQWREAYGNRDVFASICRFSRPDRSSPCISDFFIDIDDADLSIAHAEAIRASQLLRDRLGIDPDSVEVFFSGAKGFHLVVPRIVLGDPENPSLMAIWSHTARQLAKHDCSHIDMGVYQNGRLWRMPNSINAKSGLYKIPLEYKELADMGIDYILGEAARPREVDSLAVEARSEKAAAWMRQAITWLQSRKQPSRHVSSTSSKGWFLPPCMRGIEQTVLFDGIRHVAYFEYARYMATIGAAPEEILRRLLDIDRRNSIHDDAHLESLSRRAMRYAGFRTCPLPQLEPLCDRETCPLLGRSRSQDSGCVTTYEDGRPPPSTLQGSQAGQDPGSSAKGERHD